ncbi:MAG: C40 family peptidase [Acidimicrobiales bacterium]
MVGVVLACLPVSTAATLTAAPAAAAPDIPVSLEGVHGSPSPTDYWLASTSGQVWAMGDAGDYGGLAAAPAAPVVGIAPTGDKHGYWLVARDGGIFSFGDAAFYGSTGGLVLNQPVVGMAPTPEGKGSWLIAADGGIFSFGDAAFYGSMGATPTPDPAQEVVTTSSGHGYWIVDQNGTAWAFGDAGPTPPVQGLLFRPVTPGDGAVLFAFAQLGKPYIWGGNGPVGYDCSGLALAAWVSVGVSFARVSDDQYHTAGVPMSLADLQAGDLVFWGSDESDWTTVDHTAIYVGGGRIVEATGDQVQLNSLSQWGTAEVMPIGRHP